MLSGKYRLDRALGQGGMGTVWLARNEALGSDVAVKLLRPDMDAPDAGARFLREARAAASIEHPSIIRVFDVGEADGLPYIVMEHLRGESLSDLLDRHLSLPAVEAVRLLLPIADGLSRAHDTGIVHRDLKPDNIFLALEGAQVQPKLLDFGIAKLPERDSSVHLTRAGVVLGSPSYMAPEQARGLADVDQRADVWALSVVLYEAVTGSPPFQGENYNAILSAILEEEIVPLYETDGEDGLWEILRKGLQKDRAKRFQSMRELGRALASWLVAGGVHDDVRGVPLQASWLDAGAAQAAEPLLAAITHDRVDAANPDRPLSSGRPPAQSESRARRRTGPWAAAAVAVLALSAAAFARHAPAESPTATQALASVARASQATVGVGVAADALERSTASEGASTNAPGRSEGESSAAPETPRGAPPARAPVAHRKVSKPAQQKSETIVEEPAAMLDLKDPY